MSDILEQSLDDIIGQNKSRNPSSSHRRGSSRSRRGASRSRARPSHHPYRSGRRDGENGDNDDDLFTSRAAGHVTSNVPEKVQLLANSRPTLRIKNIHRDLNGEDLSRLFSGVGDVDFVKFDDVDDSVAYVCFQRDCDRSNREAIAKFDGKKAMGKILIVENTSTLFDRIHPAARRDDRRDRERERGPRRERRGAGGRATGRTRPAKKTAEDLDKELNEYMGKTTDSLDAELDNYMKGGDAEQPTEEKPPAADEMNVD
ncbi:RNA annealing protein YRA1 [Candida viswanathii]|uniref:RNA annealing protein YRA1 n=1 Tax=Candida viswanathii TaxID=5486 RepID=A0A367YE18_9ASCO|nr:RNA annealing protein YRA1 [Candida viswanathii]